MGLNQRRWGYKLQIKIIAPPSWSVEMVNF